MATGTLESDISWRRKCSRRTWIITRAMGSSLQPQCSVDQVLSPAPGNKATYVSASHISFVTIWPLNSKVRLLPHISASTSLCIDVVSGGFNQVSVEAQEIRKKQFSFREYYKWVQNFICYWKVDRAFQKCGCGLVSELKNHPICAYTIMYNIPSLSWWLNQNLL